MTIWQRAQSIEFWAMIFEAVDQPIAFLDPYGDLAMSSAETARGTAGHRPFTIGSVRAPTYMAQRYGFSWGETCYPCTYPTSRDW